MAAAGNWIMVDTAKKYMEDGTITFGTDTINVALMTSAFSPSVSGVTTFVNTNEVSNTGYTAGGQALTSKAVTQTGSTTKLSAANVVWTAGTTSLTARWAVMYKVGTALGTTNPVIGYCLLDATPADVTATSGNTFTISTPANGFFAYTGATT